MKLLNLIQYFENNIDEIGKQLLKCTCQLFRKIDETKIKPIGSGIFFQNNDEYFIFSASHVIEEITNNEIVIPNINGHYDIDLVTSEKEISDKSKIDVLIGKFISGVDNIRKKLFIY